MKLYHGISGVTLGILTYFVGGLAVGAPCPTLVGEWDVTSESAAYDSPPAPEGCLTSVVPGCFAFVSSTGILRIENQAGCVFSGFYVRTDATEPSQPLTGAIGPSLQIRMTGSATLVDGNLVGHRRIEALVSDLEIPLGRTVNTSRVTATKR
jgi:hypothetical protein